MEYLSESSTLNHGTSSPWTIRAVYSNRVNSLSRARFLKKFELTIIVRFKLEMPVAQHMSDQNKQKNEKPKLSAARLSTCDLESLV